MKLAAIGVGQAGGTILDTLLERDRRMDRNIVRAAIAVNTSAPELHSLNHVPPKNRVLIGQDCVNGSGVGADNKLGLEVMKNATDTIQQTISQLPTDEVDALLVIAGLGGGTGSGGAPVLAKHLGQTEPAPVYGLGILPSSTEQGVYALNAARCLQPFIRETDALLIYDNDAPPQLDTTASAGYEIINRRIVTQLRTLFGVGGDGEKIRSAGQQGDTNAVVETLTAGEIATIGLTQKELDTRTETGLLSWVTRNTPEEHGTADVTARMVNVIEDTMGGEFSLACDPETAERGLVVIRGPPDELNESGAEKARKWLNKRTEEVEIRGETVPCPTADRLTGVVLFGGITDASRLDQLRNRAVDAKASIDQLKQEGTTSHEEARQEGTSIEPLF